MTFSRPKTNKKTLGKRLVTFSNKHFAVVLLRLPSKAARSMENPRYSFNHCSRMTRLGRYHSIHYSNKHCQDGITWTCFLSHEPNVSKHSGFSSGVCSQFSYRCLQNKRLTLPASLLKAHRENRDTQNKKSFRELAVILYRLTVFLLTGERQLSERKQHSINRYTDFHELLQTGFLSRLPVTAMNL